VAGGRSDRPGEAIVRLVAAGGPQQAQLWRQALWKNGTVAKLAQAIYDERAVDRMPILPDALEEAGGIRAAILKHCRQPAAHVRGWTPTSTTW
jgi:hypothetical protein